MGEADRILIVYSKSYGKTKLIAKGVRKLKSRKRGALNDFCHIKFLAVAQKGLDLVTETELINNYSDLRDDLKKISVAYFFCETIDKLTRDEEENTMLFNLFLSYLEKLEKENKLKNLRNQFIFDVLCHLGFWDGGKIMQNHDLVLENILERKLSSIRVGKKIQ